MVDFTELSAMKREDLVALLSEKKKELMNLRFQKSTQQLTNTARVRVVKKEVAKILTAINKKEAA